jgi:threonine/homoserine/homoserine lactone efflux protein
MVQFSYQSGDAMEPWLATAGLVTVAAITPGPNNFIVMRAAARSGVRGAWPAIAGVVLGGLTLVLLVILGGDVLFERVPGLRTAIAAAGCAYLAWSAVRLVAGTFRPHDGQGDAAPADVPARAASLFVFQFLNPKSWVMVLSAVSAIPSDGAADAFVRLAPLFVVIPIVGLALWSSLGSLLSRALRRPAVRNWVDRAMGALLFGSAGLLLAGA